MEREADRDLRPAVPPAPTPAGAPRTPRVLSVQSTVVHGYVGNKASMFPLQLLGFDVSPIHTVQFSNHTGYARWTGSRFAGQHLADLVAGLSANGVAAFDYVLTGYAGGADLLEALARALPPLKAAGARVFCDPVMGDAGALYVPEAFVALYRSQVVPLADVLLPNQTEAELLTGIRIVTLDDAAAACARLHALGPDIVIITSLERRQAGSVETFVSEKGRGCWRFGVDRIEAVYFGTGDAIAALCLAWLHRYPVEEAVALALATLRAILRRSWDGRSAEMLLIESRDAILDPFVLPAVRPEVYVPTRS